MKSKPERAAGPLRDPRTQDPPERDPRRTWRGSERGHWALLVLFTLALLAVVHLVLRMAGAYGEGPTIAELVMSTVANVGVTAFITLVLWWGITGFSGYEHWVGMRIVLRPGAPPTTMVPILIVGGLAVVGGILMIVGVRSAALAIMIATCTLVALALLLLRRFAVSAMLSIIGIAIGVAALIVVQSVATGFQHEFERRVLGVYAHINVTRAYGISEYRRFERYLRTVDGVKGASPFVYYAMALAPTPSGTANEDETVRRASVLVKGIEPETAHEVIDLEDHLAKGMDDPVPISALTSDVALQPMPDRDDDRLPPVIAETEDPRGADWYPEAMEAWRALPDEEKYGRRRAALEDDDDWPDEVELVPNTTADDESLPTMFVGVTLARELQLEVDDVVMLVDPGASYDHTQAPEFRRYRIAGIFRAGFQEYDSRLVYLHIEELQYFKYRGKDIVSGVDLRLEDAYDAPAVEAHLRETIGDEEYSILEWQTLNANLFQSIRTQKTILTIILSLVVTVAGFNVLAALWTMVVRRTAEIAIMMSMGATEAGTSRIFQFAGMTLGAVGSICGVGFGLVLCSLVQLYGYTLDPEVYFIEELPVELSLEQITEVIGWTLFIGFVATIPPSLRAAKLRPVEGLRYE